MNVGFLAKTKWPAIRQGTPAGNEMRTARSVVGQIGPFCVGFLLGIKRSLTSLSLLKAFSFANFEN